MTNLEYAISLLKASIEISGKGDDAYVSMSGPECDEGGFYNGVEYTYIPWPVRVAHFLVEVGAIEKP
jgi:hypothetical protein